MERPIGFGVWTEESPRKRRERRRAMGASYVVGSPGRYATPKGRLTKLEGAYLTQSWSQVREGLMVKQLPQEGETYVLALSAQRVHKERAAPSNA